MLKCKAQIKIGIFENFEVSKNNFKGIQIDWAVFDSIQ